MSETVLGDRPAKAPSTGGPCTPQGNDHPGGMSGQGAAWPQSWACLRREKSVGAPGPSRTAGVALVSSRDAMRDLRGVATHRRGLVPPKGTGGNSLLRIWECVIWHGRPICRVVGDAIVLHPRRPVSLKIGPQIPILIPSPSLACSPSLYLSFVVPHV